MKRGYQQNNSTEISSVGPGVPYVALVGQVVQASERAVDGPRVQRRRHLAVGETVILLHPPLPLVGASTAMERERL